MQLFRTPAHAFTNDFSNNTSSFDALFNADFQIALLGQLTPINSCLLMHSRLNQLTEILLRETKINLVNQDVQIIEIQIVGLHFTK